jgi:hypothetical protein
MATYDVLKDIVSNGSNLVLHKGISARYLRELIEIAKNTGAKISITTNMDYNVLRELSAIGGNSLTFLDGLD